MFKRTLFSLFLSFLAVAASAGTLRETVDRTFDARAGATLTLSNTNGSITIHTWDQPRIRVQAEKKVESSDDAVAKSTMKDLRIDLTPQNGGLAVLTHYPREGGGIGLWDLLTGSRASASVTFEVTVPRAMNVDVDNVNGSVHLSDLRGKMNLETTNGRIEVVHCAGRLDAETTNGGIRAELTAVDAGQPISLETTNGRISVSLPSNVAASVDASTTNGSIHTDLPIATTRTGKSTLRGTLNGGGADLKLRTTNGSIEITKSSAATR
ncbi:MAG: hypothetical protein JWO97_2601 [Acidobacteria bacterium]|nr:hypothetical protein [Acidobacteriota bacterium]